MTRNEGPRRHVVASLAVAAVVALLVQGCAAKRDPWGDPVNGVVLSYRMADDQPLKYEVLLAHRQNMEVMGKQVEVESNRNTEYTVTSSDLENDDYRLTVTIDSMSMDIDSPQFDLSPDLQGVLGESFGLTLSRLGIERDMTGADAIRYDLGPEGERSVASDFQAIFPDLAGRPLKVGDTWTTSDTITEKNEGGEVRINLESRNRLQAFETMDGMECVRVSADVTGTLDGNNKKPGMDLVIAGTIEGTDTWYFAYKEGVFVKATTNLRTDATITGTGAQDLTIPMTQEMTVEQRLIR